MMDLQTFQHMADTYGGDLSRWPREIVSAAAKTLDADPQAAAYLQQALDTDTLIADSLSFTQISPSAQLRQRLLAIADGSRLPASLAWITTPRQLATGLMLFLVLGIFMGATNMADLPDSTTKTTAWILAPDQTSGY